MTSPPEVLFRRAAEKIFDGWTALQLAVEHGMGGPQSKAKAAAMIDAMIDLFKNKPAADWCDVADLLGDKMDDDFDTICEDNSTEEVGSLVWEFYRLISSGDLEAAEAEIAKLPSGGHWLSRSLNPSLQTNGEGGGQSSTAQEDGSSGEESSEQEMDTEVDPDPGWTQVSRRKK